MGFLDDDKDEWRFSKRNAQGHDINSKGYDKYGHFRGDFPQPSNNNTSSSSGSASSSGISFLIGIGIVGFIIYKIYLFIKANWVSITTILGTCVVCAIICFILNIKAKRLKALFITLTVIASIGIIGTVLYFGPRKTEAFIVNFGNFPKKIFLQRQQKQIEEQKPTYAYIIPDAVNFRAGPSVNNEIIGQLSKDERVEILSNSEKWHKIKYKNIEGYVDANYLRYE